MPLWLPRQASGQRLARAVPAAAARGESL